MIKISKTATVIVACDNKVFKLRYCCCSIVPVFGFLSQISTVAEGSRSVTASVIILNDVTVGSPVTVECSVAVLGEGSPSAATAGELVVPVSVATVS